MVCSEKEAGTTASPGSASASAASPAESSARFAPERSAESNLEPLTRVYFNVIDFFLSETAQHADIVDQGGDDGVQGPAFQLAVVADHPGDNSAHRERMGGDDLPHGNAAAALLFRLAR